MISSGVVKEFSGKAKLTGRKARCTASRSSTPAATRRRRRSTRSSPHVGEPVEPPAPRCQSATGRPILIAEVAKNLHFSGRFAKQIKHRKGNGQKLVKFDAKAAFIR
jgi:hypothetical protein